MISQKWIEKDANRYMRRTTSILGTAKLLSVDLPVLR